MPDLKDEVFTGLRNRSMIEYKLIAAEAKVSESLTSKIGAGNYKSCPSYDTLKRLSGALEKHPRRVAA